MNNKFKALSEVNVRYSIADNTVTLAGSNKITIPKRGLYIVTQLNLYLIYFTATPTYIETIAGFYTNGLYIDPGGDILSDIFYLPILGYANVKTNGYCTRASKVFLEENDYLEICGYIKTSGGTVTGRYINYASLKVEEV